MPIYIPKIKARYQFIDEILKFQEYWNFCTRAIFGHNMRTRFFPGMQFLENVKDHKNFRATSIPDKTN